MEGGLFDEVGDYYRDEEEIDDSYCILKILERLDEIILKLEKMDENR